MPARGGLDKVSRRLGRYDVLASLPPTPSGAVVLARRDDPRGPGHVAIQKVSADLTNGKEVAAVVAALSPLASIRHRNLVEIREVGVHDGEPFVVMEYVDGQTASTLLERLRSTGSTVDVRLAAHVIGEACAGLETAHESHVHGQLTTDDIVIGYDGSVKLRGLCLAGVIAGAGEATELGRRELLYASPERCKGEAADARSDIFSLGAILWELMSGRGPFERETQAETIRAIVSEDPAMPPVDVLRSLPMRFSEIAMTALARDRSRRYATPRAFRYELLTFVRSLPQSEAPAAELARLMQRAFDRPVDAEASDEEETRATTVPSEPVLPAPMAIPTPARSVEPPGPMPDAPSTMDEFEVSPQRRVPRAAVLAVVGVVAMIGLVALVLGSSRSTDTPGAEGPRARATASTAVAAASTPAIPSVTTSARDPSPATVADDETTLHLETTPTKATVVIDGITRGVTPLDVRLPKGRTPVDVELRRAGYDTAKERLVPDVDQKLRLALVPSAAPARGPAASASSRPYYRFE